MPVRNEFIFAKSTNTILRVYRRTAMAGATTGDGIWTGDRRGDEITKRDAAEAGAGGA